MDTGTVVWLPGSGFSGDDMNSACQQAYGEFFYACGVDYVENGTLVSCCPVGG